MINKYVFLSSSFSTANLLFNSLKPPPKAGLVDLCAVCIVYIFIFHSTRAENPLSPISHYAKIFTQHPKAQSTHSINICSSYIFVSFPFLCSILYYVAPCTEIKRDYNTNQQFVCSLCMYVFVCVCV